MSIANNFTAFNPLNIDGTSYLDSVQKDINANITTVNNLLNNVSIQSTTTFFPKDPRNPLAFRYIQGNPNAFYNIPYAYGAGIANNPNFNDILYSTIICSDSAITLNQFALNNIAYDTFGGFDSTVNHVFVSRNVLHFTASTLLPSISNSFDSFLEPDVVNGIYGTTFTNLNTGNRPTDGQPTSYLNYSGVKMYFPTSRVPRWIFVLISNDNQNWIPITQIKYMGNGNEIFRWNFASDITIQAQYWRIVVPSASETAFDMGGIEFFSNSSVGVGNQSFACSLLGNCLSYNNNPFPIIPHLMVCNDDTVLTNANTSCTMNFRCPITFRISSNKLPVFCLGTSNSTTQHIQLDIKIFSTSIYTILPKIATNKTDSGTSFSTKSDESSCGVLTSNSILFVEGQMIYVSIASIQAGQTSTKGLKLTIYSS